MSSPDKRRKNTDVTKLMSKHEVTISGGLDEFVVKFYGPEETPYAGGVWKIQVRLPEQYPFKPPKIRFLNFIYHPNIDVVVCLDVIEEAWTEKYNLSMIFDYFLPQLLTEPNPNDALRWEAASLYFDSPEEYKKKVLEYVRKYASEEALQSQQALATTLSSSSESSEDEA